MKPRKGSDSKRSGRLFPLATASPFPHYCTVHSRVSCMRSGGRSRIELGIVELELGQAKCGCWGAPGIRIGIQPRFQLNWVTPGRWPHDPDPWSSDLEHAIQPSHLASSWIVTNVGLCRRPCRRCRTPTARVGTAVLNQLLLLVLRW